MSWFNWDMWAKISVEKGGEGFEQLRVAPESLRVGQVLDSHTLV